MKECFFKNKQIIVTSWIVEKRKKEKCTLKNMFSYLNIEVSILVQPCVNRLIRYNWFWCVSSFYKMVIFADVLIKWWTSTTSFRPDSMCSSAQENVQFFFLKNANNSNISNFIILSYIFVFVNICKSIKKKNWMM